MVDESHCWSASTLEKVCHGVLANVPYRFFASATQVNNSGKTILLNSIIGKCVCSMNIGSGIDQGYLCPLKFQIASVPAMTHYAIKDPLKCKRENKPRNSYGMLGFVLTDNGVSQEFFLLRIV